MSCNVIWMDIVLITFAISMTHSTESSVLLPTNSSLRCDDARMRCAYRTGCGMALQHYLTQCTSILHGDIDQCPESCQHALIALASTDEGKELMRCNCTQEDHLCNLSKQKVEICRSSVLAVMNEDRVSCRIATWICNADAICSTAFAYYNGNCKSMFHGRKCTHRCQNSLDILRRQEKADKLNSCICDGTEDYDCKAIQRNMNLLCYRKLLHGGRRKEDRTNQTLDSGSNTAEIRTQSMTYRIMLSLTIVLLLLIK